MKKRLLILIIAALAVVLCFTACSPKDPQEEAKANIQSIKVVEGSVPTQVNIGATPDFSGIKVLVTFDDQTTKEIGFADVKISSVDTTTEGSKNVTVSYEGFSAKFEITVVDPEATATVTAIKIVPGSIGLKYYVGQTPDISTLQVEATYSTGTVKALPVSEYTYTPIDTTAEGSKTFTVTYTANTAITDSATVEVIGISSMTVSGVKKTIFVGEALDTSAMELVIKYKDGTTGSANVGSFSVGTIDSTSYGTKQLSITYNGFTIQYAVEVIGPVSLTVNKGSYSEKVLYNGTLDTSAIAAVVKYSDNVTEKTLTAADLTIGTIDTSSVGKKSLKVSYGGVETTVEINVVGVDTLTVVNGTIAKEIKKGAALDKSRVQVNVKYTDATTETVGADKLTFGAFDVNAAGEQTLSITYLDKTVNYTVKVCTITKIIVEGIETVVPAGTPIDLSSMTVKGVYNDSLESEITLTDGTITTNKDSLDLNAEEKTLVVSYNGTYGSFSANVVISAIAPELTSIEIRNYDAYIGIGGAYDKSSVVVYANYANGTSKKLTSGYTVTNIATNTVGDVTFTVSYDGKTATKTVKVLPVVSIEVSGIADKVYRGEALDTSRVSVFVTFSDGTHTDTRVVGIADGVTVTSPETATSGDKSLTVSYYGKEATVNYHVKGVVSIEILGGSIDPALRNGYDVDYSELVLKIKYTNGDEEQRFARELTGVSYAGYGKGSTLFTVTYEGKTAQQALHALVFVDISALNNTIPAEIRQGLTLSYDSIRLSVAYYNNKGTADTKDDTYDVYLVPLSDPFVTVTPAVFDSSTPGTKAIKFVYNDGTTAKETSVNVLVKGIETVEIVSGVKNVVIQGKEVDTSDLSAKVTYTDGTYVYVKAGTQGLTIHPVNTSTVGNTTLTVDFMGVPATMVITVKEAPKLSGLIFGALLPDELVARTSYMKNFKDFKSEERIAYRVGDDNPYYFYLNVIQLDDNDNIVDVDGRTVPTASKVYLIENGSKTELTGAKFTEMVKFSSADNSYDFTEAAIDKTFELEIWPADPNSYVDKSSVTKTHTVTVVDGWNVYSAKELNIMTNVEHDLTQGEFGSEHTINQKTVVTNFLAKYGITRPQNLAGVVLHCNIDVKPEDIPPEYFYEYKDKNGVMQKGFYDHFSVFNIGLTEEQKSFNIYGNYYSVYSYNLPCVVPKNVANNDDEFSSSQLFKIRLYDSNITKEDMYSQIDALAAAGHQNPFDNFSANIYDIATRDNDPNSNDQTASERHMRGLICYKVGECVTNMTNVNVEAYMTSVLLECAGSTLNLNKVNLYNAWQGHLFLWNSNEYQSYHLDKDTETKDYIQNLVVNISDSSLTKCGGPVILAQAADTVNAANNQNGVEVIVHDDSPIHTYVTGQEAWFVAVGQTQLAAQIKAMSGLITKGAAGHGYLSTSKIQGVETVNMVMVSMGSGVNPLGVETNVSFVRNGVTVLQSARTSTRPEFQNQALIDMKSQVGAAPIFQSSGGGIAYTDGATGCYGIAGDFYAGDYIALHYQGAGILLEYYHPKA